MNGLPDALRALASSVQWVAWDSVNGRKVPKSAYGGNAKANDPTTWSTFEEAAEAARKNGYAGIGIELDNGLVGIDLDHCIEDGKLKPWAQEIVDAIGSYAEISPSGEGVHILALASTDKVGAVGRADHAKGIEVYNHGRYFTVTGDAINDVPLADSTEQVQELLQREFPTESNEESLKKAFGRLVRDQVARKANETVMHNVKRDRRSGVRFARVPMGFHTCDFCMMLASRGFVYWSRETAGEFSHYHSDCRCKVVPGRPEIRSYVKSGVHVTRGFDASVEGYDPDAYYRAYELAREVGGMQKEGLLAAAGDLARNPDADEMRRNAIQMRRAMRKRVKLWEGSPSDAMELFGETGSARVDSDLAEALTYLPEPWVEKLAQSGVRIVSVDETSTGRSQFDGSMTVEMLSEDSSELAVVHELVHAMDKFDSGFMKRDKVFFEERTSGKRKKPLARLMNDSRYSFDEHAYDVDKVYSYYAYKDYDGRAYETSSMGIQLLYGDPVGLRERDPELFAFAARQLMEGARR